jgi:uncharacterized protein (TIGR02266 family)
LSGPEKRQHERVPASGVAIRVKFTDVAHLEQYYLRDISRGGIFLRAKNIKALHEHLYVVLALPDGAEIKLRGEVVHIVTPEEASAQRPSGMGIQFLDLTAEVRQQLEDYVARLKQRKSDSALQALQPEQEPAKPAAQRSVVTPMPERKSVVTPIPARKPAPTPTRPIPAVQAAAPNEFKNEQSSVSGTTYEEENDQALLRRLCWLLAEGSVMGRPVKEIFGISSQAPAELRREVYDRFRKALAPEKPPRHLGAEEARAISRLLAMLESMARED